MLLGNVIAALFIAFVTGALARFALPGPDPMPPWLTIAIGLIGTVAGTSIVLAIGGGGGAPPGGRPRLFVAGGVGGGSPPSVSAGPRRGGGAAPFPPACLAAR